MKKKKIAPPYGLSRFLIENDCILFADSGFLLH